MIDTVAGLKPGDLFTTDGRDVWEVESFFSMPSITMKNLRTGETTTAGVGALNLRPFIPLRPESRIERWQYEPYLSDPPTTAQVDHEDRVGRCRSMSGILKFVDEKESDGVGEKPAFLRKIMD
jgi:hypothetical protein